MEIGWLRPVLRALLCCALLACGDDDDSKGSPTGMDAGSDAGNQDGGTSDAGGDAGLSDAGGVQSHVGEQRSTLVRAGQAGTLAVGAVSLAVPAGAVAQDTEITVAVQDKAGKPDAANIAIDVYEFGPSGTQFAMPVTLEFDAQRVTVPSGRRLSVAWLGTDNKWNVLPTTVSNGKASASATHFTAFTLILTLQADGGVAQTGGQCDTTATFDACGGSVLGTWDYTTACISLGKDAVGGLGGGDSNPFAACTAQPYAQVGIDVMGSVTFASGNTYMNSLNGTVTGGFYVPNSCLAQVSQMFMTTITCAQIKGTTVGDNCVLNAGSAAEGVMDTGMGTYSTSGGTLTTVEQAADGGAPETDMSEYCVRGNTMTVRQADSEDGSVVILTATRR